MRFMPAPTSAGWRFSRNTGKWTHVEAAAASTQPAAPLQRPLKLATLNCLFDIGYDKEMDEVLQHKIRQEAICRELETLDADVVGLNEVTRTLAERVLNEEWVRRSYTVDLVLDDERCAHVSSLSGKCGKMMLSKIPPASVEYIAKPRQVKGEDHVMTLCLSDPDGRPLRVAISSAHFKAAPWINEGVRRMELAHLSASLTTGSDTTAAADACIIMGDFNFHREAENSSIPAGWSEIPAVVALGETWDFAKNAMMAHYLPLHNFYNGFGLGTTFGWPSPMRLDRIVVHGAGLVCAAATARLFANEPIDERAKGRPPLPQAGRALREAHRALPWQEYLFMSDHFGICVELPLKALSESAEPLM